MQKLHPLAYDAVPWGTPLGYLSCLSGAKFPETLVLPLKACKAVFLGVCCNGEVAAWGAGSLIRVPGQRPGPHPACFLLMCPQQLSLYHQMEALDPGFGLDPALPVVSLWQLVTDQ